MSDRPNPLAKVAASVGGAIAALSGVVGAAVHLGLLNQAQADAINAAGAAVEPTINSLGVLLSALIPIVAGLVAAFSTAKVGKSEVTPVADPRDNLGRPLVPVTEVSGGAHRAEES